MSISVDKLVYLGAGNPGALSALANLNDLGTASAAECVDRLESAGIRGSGIYVLWSDACGRDTELLVDVVLTAPDELLVEASGRDDRSAKDLLSFVLKEC